EEDAASSSSPVAASGIGVREITSFIIAIALLLAGLETASRSANQLGGMAGQAVSMGKSYAKAAAAAPAQAAALVGGYAARKGVSFAKAGVKAGAGKVADMYRGTTADTRARFREEERRRAERMAASTGPLAGMRRAIGRASLKNLEKREGGDTKRQQEMAKQFQGQFSTFSMDEKKAFVDRIKGKSVVSESDKARVAALENETVLDSKKFDAALKDDSKTARSWYKSVRDRAKDSGDEATLKKLDSMAESRPSLTAPTRGELAAAFSAMNKNQMQKVSADEFQNPDVLAAAMDSGLFEEIRSDRKGYSKSIQNVADRFDGTDGTTRRNRFMGAMQNYDAEKERISRMTTLTDKERERENRELEATRTYHAAAATGKVSDALGKGLKLEDVRVALDDTFAKEMASALRDTSTVGALESLSRTAVDEGGDPMQSARADAMKNFLHTDAMVEANMQNIAAGNPPSGVRAMIANTAVLRRTPDAFGYNEGDPNGGWSPQQRRDFKTTITANPKMVMAFEESIDFHSGDNPMAQAVAETLSEDQFKDMLKQLDASRGSADEEDQMQLLDRLGKIATKFEGRTQGEVKERVDKAAEFYRRRVADQLRRDELT
ncbi:hypothetical protein HYV72_02425, partial [Candidatus Uhrbacteria bacterium]|nr:hypothetical protein [Candidatus Uhrbacteria bacterium]